MKNMYLITIGLFIQFFSITATAEDNWKVRIDPEDRSRCLLESVTHTFNDGQAETSIKLVYTGEAFFAATKSNIDFERRGTGLQVDRLEPRPIDEIYMKKTAVFTRDIDKLHKEFVRGASAKLTLAFWPLIPNTETHVIEFSLYGYTRAYHQFLKCKQELTETGASN